MAYYILRPNFYRHKERQYYTKMDVQGLSCILKKLRTNKGTILGVNQGLFQTSYGIL